MWLRFLQNFKCWLDFVAQVLSSDVCMCFALRWTSHSSGAVAPPGFREHRTASPHSRIVLHLLSHKYFVWCMCFVLRWTGHSSGAVAPPGFREHRTASPHSRVVLHPTSGHTQGVDLWGRHRDRPHQWRRGQWSVAVSKEYSGTLCFFETALKMEQNCS